jgi:signal transduction histidine kinase
LAVALAALGLLADRALVREAAARAALAAARLGEDARTAALSVRGALSRIEQELLAGHAPAGVQQETLMLSPAPSTPRGRSYEGRPRAELEALLLSSDPTASGLPEAAIAALALGSREARSGAAERLVRGELPVRVEDLPTVAVLLGAGGDPRIAALQARLREAPEASTLPSSPLFARQRTANAVYGWSRRGRAGLRYEVPIVALLESAGVGARARLAESGQGTAVPDVPGLSLDVAPDLPAQGRLFGARSLLWAAVSACLVALLFVHRALDARERVVQREKVFMASVTHELLTPVTAIRIFGETLAQGAGDPREYGVLLAQESERLEALVERVLAATRIDHAPSFAPVRPADLVASAVQLMQPRAGRRAVTLSVVSLVDLGEAVWDADAVRRCLLNLIENAIKHGRQPGRVEVGGEADEAHVRLFVRDDGPGIARHDRRRLFARFARGATSATGTGLGLYLVDQVAQAHGGHVDVVSRDGEGCTFSLRLPRRPPVARGGAA